MTRLAWVGVVSAAIIGLVGGCAPEPVDGPFADVRTLTESRTGLRVEWNTQRVEDEQAEAAVRGLLARPPTADSAAQIALLNNHHLQATFEDLGVAQADLVQAGLLSNPVFNAGLRFPRSGPPGTYVDIAVAADFLEIIFLPARKDLAALRLRQARAKVAGDVIDLVAQTRGAFYDWQAAGQLCELREVAARSADAALLAARKMHDAGNLSNLELSAEQADALAVRLDLEQAQSQRELARLALFAKMGISDDAPAWNDPPHLDEPPAERFEGLIGRAIAQRQDLAEARAEVAAQARTLGLTRDTARLGELSLGPEFEHETDGQWRIGPTLSAPVPLFDQGQGRLARAAALLRQSRHRYLALCADAQAEVKSAERKLRQARSRAQAYRQQALPAEENRLHELQLHYNGGYVDLFELLRAKRTQLDLAREALNALADYWKARAELERAVGGRLPK